MQGSLHQSRQACCLHYQCLFLVYNLKNGGFLSLFLALTPVSAFVWVQRVIESAVGLPFAVTHSTTGKITVPVPRNPIRKAPADPSKNCPVASLRENFPRPRYATTSARTSPIGLCARPQHPPEDVLRPIVSPLLRRHSLNCWFECLDCNRRGSELAKELDAFRETCVWTYVYR